MDKSTATIRSKVGDFSVTFNDPNGRPIIFHWSKENNFTLEVPEKIIYKDAWGGTRVAAENYPMDLLNAYGKEEYRRKDGGSLVTDKDGKPIVVREAILELVEVKSTPSIAAPAPAKKAPAGNIEFAK